MFGIFGLYDGRKVFTGTASECMKKHYDLGNPDDLTIRPIAGTPDAPDVDEGDDGAESTSTPVFGTPLPRTSVFDAAAPATPPVDVIVSGPDGEPVQHTPQGRQHLDTSTPSGTVRVAYSSRAILDPR